MMGLGQMIWGNPTSEHKTPEYADALVEAILTEIDRVYWNIHQEQFSEAPYNLTLPEYDIECHSYYWCFTDEDKMTDEERQGVTRPNLKHKDCEIRWYKYPGRGQTTNKDWSPAEWVEWFDSFIGAIRKWEEDNENE